MKQTSLKLILRSTLYTVKYDMYSNIKIDNISIRLIKAKLTAIKIMVTLIMKESVKMIHMIIKIRIAITIKTKKTIATKIMAATQLLK